MQLLLDIVQQEFSCYHDKGNKKREAWKVHDSYWHKVDSAWRYWSRNWYVQICIVYETGWLS